MTQEARYLEDFWRQFGNSVFIGLLTMVLTVMIGSLAGFAVSRMQPSKGPLLTNTALLTYAIPASFLIVLYYRIMHAYGLSDSLWAVIAAQVAFVILFAVLILQLHASLIPLDLDDAARIEGAPFGVYLQIYLLLMVPALAVVASMLCCLYGTTILYQVSCSR